MSLLKYAAIKERLPAIITWLITGCVLGTLGLASWWVMHDTPLSTVSGPPPPLTHEIDAWARRFVLLRTNTEGRPINRVEGVYGEHYPDEDVYMVTTPRAVGLQPNTPLTVATAKIGTLYEHGKRIVMRQNAHIHRQSNAEVDALDVQSEQLTILPDEEIMHTDLPVFVARGQSHLNGRGMKYNNKTRQLEVFAATYVDIVNVDTQRFSKRTASLR